MTTTIREISAGDNPIIAEIIRQVLTEFGANREGFAFADPELDVMFETYHHPGRKYFVCEVDGAVVAGAGFMNIECEINHTCELQKMYLQSHHRGIGIGRQLLEICMKEARKAGYEHMYLETLHSMHQAQKLYEKNGFVRIPNPIGNTGHHGCDVFMIKKF